MDITDSALLILDEEPDKRAAEQVVLGYYLCQLKDEYFEPGQYVRVTRIDPDGTIYFQRRDHSYTASATEFLDQFTYAPEGEAQLQADIASVMGEINRESREMVDLHQALAQATPHLSAGSAAGVESLTALAPTTDRSLVGVKRSLAKVQGLVRDKQASLQARQNELQALMAEQMAVVAALIEPMKAMVARLQEGIWMINLYLGRDEQIVTLRDGAPAPADTPITLRQLVLSMDEECAVAAEAGGIDARGISEFDAWLLEDPAHLDQVLPELKGVVVLMPRKSDKDYGDPWSNVRMQKANHQSYWLIRNGEQLYRMATDFDVGKTLLPTYDEFLEFFYERHYNWETRTTERRPLEVGSRAYMEAEKAADARSRHYMRVALILQGLIDRTPIFHPLPGPIQITRSEAFEQGQVRIINDAELALSDGRERYRDWVARINGALEVGMRIVGEFHSWEQGFSQKRNNHYEHPRLSPARDEGPNSHTLYQLEGKRDGGFYFLYERKGHWSGTYERRGSCVVMPSDAFILAFDAATVEEMEYYLRSRLDRVEYMTMFPLLKAAIRMKRREAAQEEPFRQLLVGQIALAHGVDHETVAAEVPELVRWYKFKTKGHRPLVGDDDGKALRMIVAEFGVRQREAQNRARRQRLGEFDQVRHMVLEQFPNALLIAHKAGSEYVVLVPHNEQSVYVAEIVMTPTGERERKTWRTVDKRYERWGVFYTSERWPSWRINASPSAYLTDTEIEELGEELRERMVRLLEKSHNQDIAGEGTLLVIAFDREDQVFHTYTLFRHAVIPLTERLLTQDPARAAVDVRQYTWHRSAQRAVLAERAEHTSREDRHEYGMLWQSGYRYIRNSSRAFRDYPEQILCIDVDAVDRLQIDIVAYAAAMTRQHELQKVVHRYHQALERQWLAQWEQQAYAAFMAEFADPDLWDGHRKTLKEPRYPYWDNVCARAALASAVERGQAVDGLSFAEVVERYRAQLGEAWTERLAAPWPHDMDAFIFGEG